MAALMKRISQSVTRLLSKSSGDFSAESPLFNELLESVNDLGLEDVNFDLGLVKNPSPHDPTSGEAPCTYIDICGQPGFSIGIFVLRNGFALPMHDHPNMTGIFKVLHGKAEIVSFSQVSKDIEDDIRKAVQETEQPQFNPDVIVQLLSSGQLKCVKMCMNEQSTPSDKPCVLTPTVGNYHSVKAVDGPLAFMDILTPPYDQKTLSRACTYYRHLQPVIPGFKDYSFLLATSPPSDYWCAAAKYQGPALFDG